MDGMDERVQIRRRLGRGLNALLGDDVAHSDAPAATNIADESSSQGELRQLLVNAIERNPYQPRTEFEASSLRELSDSIQQHGVLQPLLVRATSNGGWQLIAGERRLMAAKQAGLATVPCRVLALDEQQVCEVALEENLKRKDLNVLEKAQAFANYLQQFGRTVDELAKQLSLDRSTVSNMVRLLELPQSVKSDLMADKISGGHARSLLSLKDAGQQELLCQRIQKEGLSVRKTEEAVRELLTASGDIVPMKGKKPKSETMVVELTPHVLSLRNQLRDWLGAGVEIKLSARDKGKIIIDFQSTDDFERIVGKLHLAA